MIFPKKSGVRPQFCDILVHIFRKNRISAGGVVDKNVGHCADQLAVLQDRTAAHPLDNPAAELQKPRVADPDHHVFGWAVL